jgi:hypothetical protein
MIKSLTLLGLAFFSLTAYAAGEPVPSGVAKAFGDLNTAASELQGAIAKLKDKCDGCDAKTVEGAFGGWRGSIGILEAATHGAFGFYCGKK